MTASNIPIPKICEHCGKSFIARRSITKYCSHKCNSRHYKQQRRVEITEKSTKESIGVLNTEMEKIKARDFLSIDQCTKLLGVSRYSVMRMTKSGLLASFKAGRRTIISRESINKHFNI